MKISMAHFKLVGRAFVRKSNKSQGTVGTYKQRGFHRNKRKIEERVALNLSFRTEVRIYFSGRLEKHLKMQVLGEGIERFLLGDSSKLHGTRGLAK